LISIIAKKLIERNGKTFLSKGTQKSGISSTEFKGNNRIHMLYRKVRSLRKAVNLRPLEDTGLPLMEKFNNNLLYLGCLIFSHTTRSIIFLFGLSRI
jgi:hypothetical protein